MKSDFAYLAGLLDGEGYFGIIPHHVTVNSYRPAIKLASVTEGIVLWLHASFGGYMHKRKMNGNKKTAFDWTLHDKASLKIILKEIMPFLKIKRAQAELLLLYVKKSSYKNLRSKNPEIIQREIEFRKHVYESIRLLNFRGLPLAETE